LQVSPDTDSLILEGGEGNCKKDIKEQKMTVPVLLDVHGQVEKNTLSEPIPSIFLLTDTER